MLVDKRYRDWVVKQVKDPMVRSFWSSLAAAGREIANNLLGKVLVDFIVSWHRLALAGQWLSVEVMFSPVANQLASHFMKAGDQIAPLHATSSSPTLRIPGIWPEDSSL